MTIFPMKGSKKEEKECISKYFDHIKKATLNWGCFFYG